MNLEQQRRSAQTLLNASHISVLPYGNAWWLVGNGINQVVGELAGLQPEHLRSFPAARR